MTKYNPVEENPLLDLEFDDDATLDEAMREREVIENGERDLDVLRRYSDVRAGRALFFGKWFSAIALSFLALSPGLASADAPKVKKPTLCMSGTPVTGERFAGFLCTDGKRPKLFTRYVEVQFVDEHGKAASYVLGWTGAQPKPIPLPRKLPKDEKPVSTVRL